MRVALIGWPPICMLQGMIAYKHEFLVQIELDFHTLGRNERNNNHQSHGAGLSLYHVKMNERRYTLYCVPRGAEKVTAELQTTLLPAPQGKYKRA